MMLGSRWQMRVVALASFLTLVAGCGSREKRESGDQEDVPAAGSGPTHGELLGSFLQQMEGRYESKDLTGVYLTITPDFHVETNLIVPLEQSNGSRLKPVLNHRLLPSSGGTYYTTQGSINRPGGIYEPLEFRVDSYDGGEKLDVTIIVNVLKSEIRPFTVALASAGFTGPMTEPADCIKFPKYPQPVPTPTCKPTPTPTFTPTPTPTPTPTCKPTPTPTFTPTPTPTVTPTPTPTVTPTPTPTVTPTPPCGGPCPGQGGCCCCCSCQSNCPNPEEPAEPKPERTEFYYHFIRI